MRSEDTVSNTGNAILYRRWNGASWSPAVDVLSVHGEVLAEFPAVDIDGENRLHIVWEAMTRLYYSSAPSWQATSAHAWTKPVALAENTAAVAWGSDISVDASGTLHVIFTTRGPNAAVYYIHSRDGGMSWHPPIQLSDPRADLEDSFSAVKIAADDSGSLHAVWQTNQAQGYGQAIYYARCIAGGESWGRPVQLGWRDPQDYEASWPYLTPVGAPELHLIYVDGPGTGSVGRYHRISSDGGETWTRPHHILTGLVGVNGYVVPIADGAGQIHLIINMRTRDTQTVGIYYARWSGDGWSPVEPVDVSSEAAVSAHHAAATVRRGNEVHVTDTQLAGGEIWHIFGVIASLTPKQVLAPPRSQASPPSVELTETALPTLGPPSHVGSQPTLESRSSLTSRVAGLALAPAVVMPLLLLIAVSVWARASNR
jgi:hypothetical protein